MTRSNEQIITDAITQLLLIAEEQEDRKLEQLAYKAQSALDSIMEDHNTIFSDGDEHDMLKESIAGILGAIPSPNPIVKEYSKDESEWELASLQDYQDTDPHLCPVCDSVDSAVMGSLGKRVHLRCNGCGWTFSHMKES